jgi:hypothetical protein
VNTVWELDFAPGRNHFASSSLLDAADPDATPRNSTSSSSVKLSRMSFAVIMRAVLTQLVTRLYSLAPSGVSSGGSGFSFFLVPTCVRPHFSLRAALRASMLFESAWSIPMAAFNKSKISALTLYSTAASASASSRSVASRASLTASSSRLIFRAASAAAISFSIRSRSR